MIIEGKEYISSRRAAEMGKYNNDYIGQLCRSGKISARMIGRSWFVELNSLTDYIKAIEVQKHAQGVQSHISTQVPVSASVSKIKKVEVEQLDSVSDTFIKPAVSTYTPYPSTAWTVTYSEDNRPLMPAIEKVSCRLAFD